MPRKTSSAAVDVVFVAAGAMGSCHAKSGARRLGCRAVADAIRRSPKSRNPVTLPV